VANKKMISRELVKEVHTEARKLRKAATEKELRNLDFSELRVLSPSRCIYGQMTGDCFSSRAEGLIQQCAKHVIDTHSSIISEVTCELKAVDPSQIHQENKYGRYLFSPIEVYIGNDGADNRQLIAFLKGERKTLNLYPNCRRIQCQENCESQDFPYTNVTF